MAAEPVDFEVDGFLHRRDMTCGRRPAPPGIFPGRTPDPPFDRGMFLWSWGETQYLVRDEHELSVRPKTRSASSESPNESRWCPDRIQCLWREHCRIEVGDSRSLYSSMLSLMARSSWSGLFAFREIAMTVRPRSPSDGRPRPGRARMAPVLLCNARGGGSVLLTVRR